jgi:hypothetical protein
MIEIALLVSAGFTIGAALLGLVALYQQLGLTSLWLTVGLLYVIYAVLQRRGRGRSPCRGGRRYRGRTSGR